MKLCWLMKSLAIGEAVVFSIILRELILNLMFTEKMFTLKKYSEKSFAFISTIIPTLGSAYF